MSIYEDDDDTDLADEDVLGLGEVDDEPLSLDEDDDFSLEDE